MTGHQFRNLRAELPVIGKNQTMVAPYLGRGRHAISMYESDAYPISVDVANLLTALHFVNQKLGHEGFMELLGRLQQKEPRK